MEEKGRAVFAGGYREGEKRGAEGFLLARRKRRRGGRVGQGKRKEREEASSAGSCVEKRVERNSC